MKIFFKKFGQKDKKIIILHGLYGMSDNWVSVGKKLAQNFTVYIPDLRNHGRSFHSEKFDYQVLVEDLIDFMEENCIPTANFIGHSMGGRITLFFAEKFPQRVEKAVIVDIPPRNLTDDEFFLKGRHKLILKTAKRLNLNNFSNRAEVVEFFTKKLNDKQLSFFLAKNIGFNGNKLFWKINIDAIEKNIEKIGKGFDNFNYSKLKMPILFLKGEKSNYIKNSDIELIKNKFPNATVKIIPNTTHWLHYEAQDVFVDEVLNFLN